MEIMAPTIIIIIIIKIKLWLQNSPKTNIHGCPLVKLQ